MAIMVRSILKTLPQCYSFASQTVAAFHQRFPLIPPKKKVNIHLGMIL